MHFSDAMVPAGPTAALLQECQSCGSAGQKALVTFLPFEDCISRAAMTALCSFKFKATYKAALLLLSVSMWIGAFVTM